MRTLSLLAKFLVCGMVSGIAIAAILIALAYAEFAWKLYRDHVDPVVRPIGFDPQPPDLIDVVLRTLIVGALLGVVCAIPITLIANIWPPAKRPQLAAALCASLGGSFFLVIVAIHEFSRIRPTDLPGVLLAVVVIMVMAAIYGFVLAYLAGVLEKRMAERGAT